MHISGDASQYTYGQYTRFAALHLSKVESKLLFEAPERLRRNMTPILIALVAVLPLAVAGLSLLFISGNPPHNPHHRAINLWDLK
jgi:hypothetical protein